MRTSDRTARAAVLSVLLLSPVMLLCTTGCSSFRSSRLQKTGGLRAVVRLHSKDGGPVTQSTQNASAEILSKRLNALGVSEPVVRPQESDQILIEIPLSKGVSMVQARRDLDALIAPAALEFIWLKEVRTAGAPPRGNQKGRYVFYNSRVIQDAQTRRMLKPEEVRQRILYADPEAIIVSDADLKPNGARVDVGPGPKAAVLTQLQFNDEGTAKFADFTTNHTGALLAVVLNGKIQSAPWIKDPIMNGTAVITGAGNIQEAQDLANLLNSGALPARLEIVSVKEFPVGK